MHDKFAIAHSCKEMLASLEIKVLQVVTGGWHVFVVCGLLTMQMPFIAKERGYRFF
jgi:hypothetical protein